MESGGLEIEIASDFADQEEARTGQRQQRGSLKTVWKEHDGAFELVFDYRAEHHFDHQGDRGTATLHRGLRLRVTRADSSPEWDEGRIRFAVALPPGGRWHACIDHIPMIDGVELLPIPRCPVRGERRGADGQSDGRSSAWTDVRAGVDGALSAIVSATIEQAKRDLGALRLPDLDRDDSAWTVAAGLPTYVGLFGRDALTAGWQASLVGPEILRGSLVEIAARQGKENCDWRDEQPGRMLHEARTGPLALLEYNPRARATTAR